MSGALSSAIGAMTAPRWLLAAVLVAGGLGSLGGFFAGREWQAGQQASAELARTAADLAALRQQTSEFSAAIALVGTDLNTASARLGRISEEYQDDLHDQAIAAADRQRQLDAALAQRRDLADVHVGADLLHAWNAANAGGDTGAAAGAGQPAAAARPGPDRAVPEPATGHGRRGTGADRQPRQQRHAVPRLPAAAGTPERSGASAPADRARTDQPRQRRLAGGH